MLTSRGWWLLMLALLITGLGLVIPKSWPHPTALLGFTILGWFLVEWFLFRLRLIALRAQLAIHRTIRDGKRPVPSCWAGGIYEVRVGLRYTGRLRIPYVHIEDLPPMRCELLGGSTTEVGRLDAAEELTIGYRIKTPTPGEIRFEGVELCVADLQGFFMERLFLRRTQVLPVLPPLVDAGGQPRTNKRRNRLLPPGVHRLRAAGSGSELLDLRDYRPGDPPKMIAWKPSARKDKIITKEFENEVPIRCTLFVDVAQGTRVGVTGQGPLTRLSAIAAGVVQAAAAARDLTGVVLFDEHGTRVIDPSRGSQHVVSLIRLLGDAAKLQPSRADPDDAEILARLAMPIAERVYPDLIDDEVNHLPWTSFWRPVLDTTHGPFVVFLACTPLLLLWKPWRDFLRASADLLFRSSESALTLLLSASVPAFLGLLVWLWVGMQGMLNPLQSRRARRKKLATLFTLLHKLPVGAIEQLIEDDAAFALEAQRFLADHHAPYPLALYDLHGRYRFRSEAKVERLAQALTRAIGKAHDNELFVLMVDLFDLDEKQLEPLLKAVRVAKARHHQVIVLVPWQKDIPEPKDDTLDPSPLPPKEVGPQAEKLWLSFLRRQLIHRYHGSWLHVRRIVGKLGVSILCAKEGESVRLILNRMARIRRSGVHYR